MMLKFATSDEDRYDCSAGVCPFFRLTRTTCEVLLRLGAPFLAVLRNRRMPQQPSSHYRGTADGSRVHGELKGTLGARRRGI